MKKTDVIAFFGSPQQTANKLKISHAAVSKWGFHVPELRALQVEKLSNGALRAETPYPSSCDQYTKQA